jgi:type IV pilus assembly protein PilE
MTLGAPISDNARFSAAAPASRRLSRGFTLIELMIVVAVVAILAAIALPNFNDSVRKSRRGQAKADMVELAQIYERFHTDNNTYVGASAKPGFPTQSPKTGTARYSLSAPAPVETQSTFVITATPLDAQTKDACGTMTIDQAGRKTPAIENCWQ